MEKIILYGAGQVGSAFYTLLEGYGLKDKIHAFCDKNADKIKKKFDKDVLSYEEAIKLNIPFIISVSKNDGNSYQLIKEKLEKDNITFFDDILDWEEIKKLNLDKVKFNNDYCAAYHIYSMDDYFQQAESNNALNTFWDKNSTFYQLFQKLDLQNVVELACGRGRHVPQYLSQAGNVTLVDILEKNIEYVKNRFIDFPNVHCYKNNGYDLSELADNTYTSIFTYDSMVHFELLDIYNYLKETQRILAPGGLGLFHHSNESSDYKNSFEHCTNKHGRNFMDKKLFAYLAHRSGLEIVEQHIIDWGGYPNLDCITLVRKK